MTRESHTGTRRELKIVLVALSALLGLGILAGVIGWWLRPPAVPGTPESFTARFGEPETEYDDELASGGSVTRSLVYERARVRAVFAFDRHGKSWYFVGFFEPNSQQPLNAEQATAALAVHKPSSLFPLRRR